MREKLKTRALQMAHSDPARSDVWTYLSGAGRPRLIDAAEAGRVPVTAVSAELLRRLGAKAFEAPLMRQFVGIAVSAIMAEEGFVVSRSGVRFRGDPLFGAGTLFERAPEPLGEDQSPLLARFIDALSEDELAFAAARIRKRLHALPQQASSSTTKRDRSR